MLEVKHLIIRRKILQRNGDSQLSGLAKKIIDVKTLIHSVKFEKFSG